MLLIGEAEKSTTLSNDGTDIAIAVAWMYSEESQEVNKLNENREPVLDDNDTPIKENIIVSGWGDLPAGSTYRYCPELKNPIIIHYNSQFYLFGDGFEAFYTSPSGRDWEKLIKSSHSLIKIGLKRTLDMILLSSPNLEAERTFPW